MRNTVGLRPTPHKGTRPLDPFTLQSANTTEETTMTEYTFTRPVAPTIFNQLKESDQRSAFDLGERIDSQPLVEPERIVFSDSYFQGLTPERQAVDAQFPERRRARLWRWQSAKGLPSGRLVRGLPASPPLVSTMRYLVTMARELPVEWSEVPTREELGRAASMLRGVRKDRDDQAAGSYLDSSILDSYTSRVQMDDRALTGRWDGSPDAEYIGSDERNTLDAMWHGRDSRLEGWDEIDSALGSKWAVLQSRGPRPTRAIGTLAGQLAAKAHRLMETLVVQDGRAVIVRGPSLVPVPGFLAKTEVLRTPWGTLDRITTYTGLMELRDQPKAEKHFYAGASEALVRGRVERIVRWAGRRGPVRVYRPDPLRDSDRITDSARRWRREQRHLRSTTQTTRLPSGKRITSPRPRLGVALTTTVLPAWRHLIHN